MSRTFSRQAFSRQPFSCQPLSRQKGSVLIISLIILTVLTLIGVTGMRSTTMEEKMAGNMRDKTLSFQAAEAALRRGEQFFHPLVGTGAFDGSDGQYGPSDADPDFFDPATWSESGSIGYQETVNNVATPPTLAGLAAQPRYILKYVGNVSVNNNSLNMGGYGQQKLTDVSHFRVTARAVGGTTNTATILQSYYGKRL